MELCFIGDNAGFGGEKHLGNLPLMEKAFK